ncbi:MAG: DUF4167 domain-containing protein [Magnetospiraceae bacterium]
MNKGPSSKRSRPRGNNRRGPNRNTVFDSNGPDVRVRGTAQQVIEKYLSLARDAASSGDRVSSENYLQHADHYQRLLAEVSGMRNEGQPRNDPNRDRRRHGNGAGHGDMDSGDDGAAEDSASQNVQAESSDAEADAATPAQDAAPVEAPQPVDEPKAPEAQAEPEAAAAPEEPEKPKRRTTKTSRKKDKPEETAAVA